MRAEANNENEGRPKPSKSLIPFVHPLSWGKPFIDASRGSEDIGFICEDGSDWCVSWVCTRVKRKSSPCIEFDTGSSRVQYRTVKLRVVLPVAIMGEDTVKIPYASSVRGSAKIG